MIFLPMLALIPELALDAVPLAVAELSLAGWPGLVFEVVELVPAAGLVPDAWPVPVVWVLLCAKPLLVVELLLAAALLSVAEPLLAAAAVLGGGSSTRPHSAVLVIGSR